MFSSLVLEVPTLLRRMWYTTFCVLSWNIGKLPVLESCSCSAYSYLGRSAALCMFLIVQMSVPGGTPACLKPKTCLSSAGSVLRIFGREAISVVAPPAKLGLALSPYPPCWAGCSLLCWLEREDPTTWMRKAVQDSRYWTRAWVQI